MSRPFTPSTLDSVGCSVKSSAFDGTCSTRFVSILPASPLAPRPIRDVPAAVGALAVSRAGTSPRLCMATRTPACGNCT